MSVSAGRGKKRVVLEDFAEGRVVQLAVADRLTGSRELVFLSMPQKSFFLEGYIQGIVTDYDDNPIQGVVVEAVAKGEKKFIDQSKAAFQTTSFDAGVSDTNGVYRIRFSLPVIKNVVDIRGELNYNPAWEQQCENLASCYEPQIKKTPFRLYFDMKRGMIVFAEGVRKVVVRAKAGKGAGVALPGAGEPAAARPAESEIIADPFKDFGLP